MSTGASKLSTSLDESQLSQVRECLANFTENRSPGLHQDATMDNSYAMGFRSPSINALAGHGSPVQVRSLRENEEEMSTLRKENFNLKLRIYFLEHRAGFNPDSEGLGLTSSSSTSGASCEGGNYLKQNIDLKVELESLRHELQEKQELLCQAAKAIEVLEEGHRKTEEKHREMVADLNNRIDAHLLEIKSLEKVSVELQQLNHELRHSAAGRGDHHQQNGAEDQEEAEELAMPGYARASARDAVGESLLDFLDTVQQHSELSVQEKLKALEMDNIVRQCQERNDELTRQLEQLQIVTDEKTASVGRLEVQLSELRFENAELREKLEELPSQADVEIDRLKKQIFDIRAELAEKLCVLDDTETKLKEKTVECMKSCKVVEKLVKTITEQDREIAKLKRNSAISLPSEHGASTAGGGPNEAIEIVDQDRKPVSQAEYDALVQRAKLLQQKNDTLIHKLCGGGDQRNDRNIIIKQLNDELIQAREEAEKAQRWRKECADLCAISTLRLEELAGFLDSLLKNKELVGTLSMDRRKAIRKAVDRSLDLSRSLNMSISVTGFSLIGNNSLAQLSCLSGFLEQSLDVTTSAGGAGGAIVEDEANKENRTSNNHQHQPATPQTKQMIETLRAENRALRGELFEQQQQLRSRRRESKERKSAPVAVEPVSDSEAWSEPDRDVSLARIGLEDNSALLRQKHSPGGVGVVMGGPVGAAGLLSTSGTAILELSSTSDNEPPVAVQGITGGAAGARKAVSVAEFKLLQDTVTQLNGELRAKDGTIGEIEARLAELDGELQRERTRLASVESEANGWEREALEAREKAERASERLVTLESDIHQKDALIEKLRKEREQAAVDLRVAEMKLDAMRTEYEDMQQRHKRELESMLAAQQTHLDELRHSLTESFHGEMERKQQSFDAALAQNYISKNIHQEKLSELDELHYRLEDAHNDLATMARAEEGLRAQLAEGERLVATMKRSLDEATLHASKLAVERTKALNEKRQLEADLGRARDDLELMKGEKNELNQRLQVALLEQQTAAAAKAATHDRSIGAGGGGVGAAGSRSRDGRHSSSATDEELLPIGRRRLENSSPDLGIESDPGRLSNVELMAAGCAKPSPSSVGGGGGSPQQRPLLKTLELTKSMSNLLLNPTMEVKTEDGDSPSAKGGSTANTAGHEAEKTTIVKHDCAKIESDYAELRRRYKETRRCLTQAYDNIKQANRRKEQLEVDIKQQIHKTRDVLRTVHNNMDPAGDRR